jgi:hypothetical protein
MLSAIVSYQPDLEGGGCTHYIATDTPGTKPQLDVFQQLCRYEGLPTPVREYKFHAQRKWRIDYYFQTPSTRLALEVEGGIYTQGRHTRGSGFVKDIEKYNAITMQGIVLLRTSPKNLLSYSTIQQIKHTIKPSPK